MSTTIAKIRNARHRQETGFLSSDFLSATGAFFRQNAVMPELPELFGAAEGLVEPPEFDLRHRIATFRYFPLLRLPGMSIASCRGVHNAEPY